MQTLLPKSLVARFLNPWPSKLLELSWQRVLQPICKTSVSCHQPETRSLPRPLAVALLLHQQKEGEKKKGILNNFPSAIHYLIPLYHLSFLLATKFIFQSWQALVVHKSSPLLNHFHQLCVNFLYFIYTFFEMEMDTAFEAKACHPFMWPYSNTSVLFSLLHLHTSCAVVCFLSQCEGREGNVMPMGWTW